MIKHAWLKRPGVDGLLAWDSAPCSNSLAFYYILAEWEPCTIPEEGANGPIRAFASIPPTSADPKLKPISITHMTPSTLQHKLYTYEHMLDTHQCGFRPHSRLPGCSWRSRCQQKPGALQQARASCSKPQPTLQLSVPPERSLPPRRCHMALSRLTPAS